MNYCPFALPTVGKRVQNPILFDNKFTSLSSYKPNLPNSFISRRSHLFTFSSFHLFTLSPFHPFTFSPFHPFTLSTFHPFTLSPFHPFTFSPFHPFTFSPFHPFNFSPFHPFNFSPFHPFNFSPFQLFTLSPFHLFTFISLFTLPNGVCITNFPLPFPLIVRRFYLHLSVFVYFKQAFCPYIKIIAYFCRCCAMRNKTKRDAESKDY